MARKKKNQDKDKQEKKDANVHKDLKGLDININPFGEIETNFDIEKINKFLNKHVEDKKLKERDEMKKKGLAKDSPKPDPSEYKKEEKSGKKGKQNNDEDEEKDK